VAPYIILPGVHQSTVVIECSFNKEVWDRLSFREQEMIEMAAIMEGNRIFQETGHNDSAAYKFFKDSGTEFVTVNDEVLNKAAELTVEWEDKTAAELGGWFSKVLTSQRAYQASWANSHEYRDNKKGQ
jgi:TRAP-type mannitol/chloroaromatic compound transport system substrate-binding protein